MLKFVLILAFVFAAFYFGGALLFDSGIAGNSMSRVPAAVQVGEFYNGFNQTIGGAVKSIDVYVAPIRYFFLKQVSNDQEH